MTNQPTMEQDHLMEAHRLMVTRRTSMTCPPLSPTLGIKGMVVHTGMLDINQAPIKDGTINEGPIKVDTGN